MTRTGQAAIDYARSRVGGTMADGSGYCLKFVRECFEVGSYYASAIDAWNASPTQHPGDRHPPAAVPLFFRSPSQYDHVVFCASETELISTYNEQIRSYPSIGAVEQAFDASLLGWTEDLNRVTVWEGDDEMPSAEEVAAAVWAYGINRPGAPVSDAGTFLADTRVIVDQGTASTIWHWPINGTDPATGAPLADTAAAFLRDARDPNYQARYLWDFPVADQAGSDHARNWLTTARRAPETNAKLDELLSEPSATSRRSLLTFVLAILIAVIGGVAIGILSDTRDGVIAGVAAIVGSLLMLVLRDVAGRGRHRADTPA